MLPLACDFGFNNTENDNASQSILDIAREYPNNETPAVNAPLATPLAVMEYTELVNAEWGTKELLEQ